MEIINISPKLEKSVEPNLDKINLFYQFFIHSKNPRSKEIKKCLKFNVQNEFIDQIYLLNEKIYSTEELGIESEKIIQINIETRLKFKDVFNYINDNKIQGYNVIINADIFLDESINNLKYTDMHIIKKMMAILRYEYNYDDIKESKIYGPRVDSQDTWIIHSNFNIKKSEEKIFNFEFGKPGCDNKLVYLMNILGYQLINDPGFIKTYHIHASTERDYLSSDRIEKSYGFIIPASIDLNKLSNSNSLAIIGQYTRNFQDIRFDDNTLLYYYILQKIKSNQPFIIPRIAGIENNIAVQTKINQSNNLLEIVKIYIPKMKNNAGIKLTSEESIIKYSDMYLEAFKNAEIYFGWDIYGNVYPSIAKSQDFIKNLDQNKKIIWARALDIFNYIKSCPWTWALIGKRILIISPFEDSIQEKISIRKEIYGVDLFPECEIITIKPPQTQGTEESREFDIELKIFTDKLDLIKNDYDIALVSCGGYGNLVCNHIYKSGKSAIYVGGVLQMYFGILGNRWIKEMPDIVRLYLNNHWSRPKDEEKPTNHNNIESSCYW